MTRRWKSVSDWASFMLRSLKKVVRFAFCPLFCTPGKSLPPSSIPSTIPMLIKRSYVEYKYVLSMMKPFPFQSYPNIEVLALKVLQRFSRAMLYMAEQGQRYGPSGKPRPLEVAYQDEFYRCFGEEVGPGVGIVSERSCVGQGRIDFHIITPHWGFELLHDGDRPLGHCNRFKPGGTYHQSIQQGLLTNWLILDCRRSIPRKHCKDLYFLCFLGFLWLMSKGPEPKLWRIIFFENYSCARILNGDNEEIYPEFHLTNY